MDNKNFNVYTPIDAARRFIAREKILCHQGVVLAISGGVDSTVMAFLFKELGINTAVIAHCNFKLRGSESDEDEAFVEKLGLTLGFPVNTYSFDTTAFAAENKISVQLAARRLRYEWLENLRKELGFAYIATAHHADDNAETVLQHIIDGTGLAGLRGIPAVNGKLIRPILDVNKNDLVEYAQANNIEFRTDSSNLKSDYTRNRIRNEVIPPLTNMNPSFVKTLNANAARWNDAYLIYENAVEKNKRKLLKSYNNHATINIASLQSNNAAATLLYELLKDFGFNSAQAAEIWETLVNESGKTFFSHSHRALKDRTQIIITEKDILSFHQLVEKGSATFNLPNGKIAIEKIPNSPDINFENTRYQFLDADKLQFPLTLRPWKKGDYLYPFGLNKKKKVSDLFTDKKMSLVQKEEQPLLQSGEHVIAVPGLTIDHRFRVTNSTRLVVKIFYNKIASNEHA